MSRLYVGLLMFSVALVSLASAEVRMPKRHGDLFNPSRAVSLLRFADKQAGAPDEINNCLIFRDGNGIVFGSGKAPFPEPKRFNLVQSKMKKIKEALLKLPKFSDERGHLTPNPSDTFPQLSALNSKEAQNAMQDVDPKSELGELAKEFCPLTTYRADVKGKLVAARYSNFYRDTEDAVGVCLITQAGQGYTFLDWHDNYPLFNPFTLRPKNKEKLSDLLKDFKGDEDKEDLSPQKEASNPVMGAYVLGEQKFAKVERESELGKFLIATCEMEATPDAPKVKIRR